VIQNVGRKQQINDFSELRFGNITPTDMDGCIECKDKAYIFIEIKYMNKEESSSGCVSQPYSASPAMTDSPRNI
jgi:hypothetical protein